MWENVEGKKENENKEKKRKGMEIRRTKLIITLPQISSRKLTK